MLDEATVRLVGYMFDIPYATRGSGFSNHLRFSGAARILLPYVVHNLGKAEAVAAAQAAVGSADNPVTDVTTDTSAGTLTVSYADGTTNTRDLPAGMGGGTLDQTARDAAATAQTRADNAKAAADAAQTTATNAATAAAAAEASANAAHTASHDQVLDVENGRLPGPPVAMRLGWSQSRTFTALDFNRPPMGGSAAGMSDGLAAPPFPPSLNTDSTLYLGLWLAGDPDIADLPSGFAATDKRALAVDGTAGHYFPSSGRLAASVAGTVYRVVLAGPRILTENDLAGLGGGVGARVVTTYTTQTTSARYSSTGFTPPADWILLALEDRPPNQIFSAMQVIDLEYMRSTQANSRPSVGSVYPDQDGGAQSTYALSPSGELLIASFTTVAETHSLMYRKIA